MDPEGGLILNVNKNFSDCLCIFYWLVHTSSITFGKVEELQYQLHAKGKEVDTAASALGSALDEIKQLQTSSHKVW
jgi:hypothetical protein